MKKSNKKLFNDKWEQVKEKAHEKWPKFSKEDISEIKGIRDQVIHRLQEKYGYTKEKAEEELAQFENDYDTL